MVSGEEYTIDNSPFITQGHYYVVSVGGTTTLNGVSNWSVGDWVIAGANNQWTKLDHSQVDGTGTTGNLTKWSATQVIADSIVSESGSAITVDGSLSTNTNLSSTGDFAVNTDKFTVAAASGNTAFVGDLAINTNKFTVNATSGDTSIAGDVSLPDDKKLILGTGNDLQIYHDSNNSFIKDAGTGDLVILSNTISINNAANSENIAKFIENGAVELYYDNSKKFETTNTGVTVTGGISLSGDISASTGDLALLSSSGEYILYGATNGQTNLYHNGVKKFETTSTGIEVSGTASTFAGSVGINTAPQFNRELLVKGEISALAQDSGDNQLLFAASSTQTNISATYGSSGSYVPMQFETGGGVRLTIDSSGVATFAGRVVVDNLYSSTFVEAATLVYTSNGSEGAPSYTFSTDPNTGIYRPSADTICFSTGGSERMRISSNGRTLITVASGNTIQDSTLQLKATGSSDNAGIMFVNSGNTSSFNDIAGIASFVDSGSAKGNLQFWTRNSDGDNSDVAPRLTIDSSGTVQVRNDLPRLQLYNTDTSLVLDQVIGTIDFYKSDASGSGVGVSSSIQVRSNSSIGANSYMAFHTDGGSGLQNQEKMRIDSSGALLVGGTDSPSTSWKGTGVFGQQGTNKVIIGYLSAFSENIVGGHNSALDAWDSLTLAATDFKFRTGSGATDTSMVIDSSGNVGINETNPAVPLHISRDSASGENIALLLDNNNTTAGNEIGILFRSMAGSTNTDFEIFGKANGANDMDLVFQSDGSAERMRITSGGQVNIYPVNDTSEAFRVFRGTGAFASQSISIDAKGGDANIRMIATDTARSTIFYRSSDGGGNYAESMRITSDGTFLVNQTTPSTTADGFGVHPTGSGGGNLVSCYNGTGNTALIIGHGAYDGALVDFRRGSTQVGTISVSTSATQYNTSSDYRLKEDLQDFAGLDMVSKIPVYDFKWKTDESRSYGVMAHELQEVLPNAVTGDKDEEEMQSVDYSKIVPLLVKSIQELTAKVEKLEGECKCKN